MWSHSWVLTGSFICVVAVIGWFLKIFYATKPRSVPAGYARDPLGEGVYQVSKNKSSKKSKKVAKPGKKGSRFPMTHEEYQAAVMKQSGIVPATINGMPVVVPFKKFSTGSVGFYTNGKVTLQIGDKMVEHQMGITLTAIGSKPPEEDEDEEGDDD